MRLSFGLILMAWIGTSIATEKVSEPISFIARAKVMIDDQGAPQQVQAYEKLPVAIKSAIEQRVMGWRFEPARMNGVAKSGVTYVYVNACVAATPDKGMAFSMSYLSNGPAYANGQVRMPPLRYPVDAARSGNEGSFRLVTHVSPDGRASIESIETKTGTLKSFEKTLQEWIASIRFLPEEVDGVAIATRIGVPVDFSLGSNKRAAAEQRTAAQRSPECMAATGKAADPTQPVVLDSPFKPRSTS